MHQAGPSKNVKNKKWLVDVLKMVFLLIENWIHFESDFFALININNQHC